MTTADTARTALGGVVLAARDLSHRLDDAREVEWLGALRPRMSREDAALGRHGSGERSDPTVAVALDESRLGVRGAVAEAERARDLAHAVVAAADLRLADALAEWHGEPRATPRGARGA
ncbi:hypothetical protein OMK64_01895 [Cellulomonas fimi]|uniref:DUF7169 domain-containing protein n=1 Tax=Cellulomonas fimi TaxID=1708 RepID=UPI00234D9914|nr:hypothetical protein [Cellulomonas fimi]MDC7120284.1 hypothetical protein [Cellulomonas fimi]